MKYVLFACVHNSGRSQMAEAFAREMTGADIEFGSAGTSPADQVDPLVVEAMREREIDISLAKPRLITPEMADRADRVITMGCDIGEACPTSDTPTEDWGLDDPKGKTIDEVREIRDHIEARVRRLIQEEARS